MGHLSKSACAVATTALIAGGLATGTPAVAAPDPVDSTLCAGTPVWTGGFEPGQAVTGKTTSQGTAVEGFTGEYIDTLDGGSEADSSDDILLFKLSGSRITDATGKIDAGIWAGISGSPVYDLAGNLIGSVSYGFTGLEGSQTAGVTPAANLFATKRADPAPVTSTRAVPKTARSAMKAAGEPSASTIKRLELPRVTVGSSATSHRFFANKSRTLSKRNTNLGLATGSATGIDTIEPGGSIATSWSSGSTLIASVGTVTAVCGDEVFAFGHPDEDTGESNQTFHSASVAHIQRDGGQSFKLANINPEPAGAVLEDGNNGVYGVVGRAADSGTTVQVSTRFGTTSVNQTSTVSEPRALSTIIANQVYTGLAKSLGNGSGPGTVEMSWTIVFRESGSSVPRTYKRSQRFSSPYEVASTSIQDVAGDTEFLQLATDTDLAIDSVKVDSTVISRKLNTQRVSHIDYLRKGKWVKLTPRQSTVYHKKGTSLQTRIQLVPTRGSSAPAQTIASNFSTTKSYSSTGRLTARGSVTYSGYDEDFDEEFYDESWDEDYEDDWEYEGPYTLAEALTALGSQVRSDQVLGQMNYRQSSRNKVTARQHPGSGPVSGSVTFPIVFQK